MIHPNHIGYRRENESKVPAEEAPEESRISRNMGIKPTCSLVSLRAVLSWLCNTTVLIHQSSCSSSFQIQPRNIRITQVILFYNFKIFLLQFVKFLLRARRANLIIAYAERKNLGQKLCGATKIKKKLILQMVFS